MVRQVVRAALCILMTLLAVPVATAQPLTPQPHIAMALAAESDRPAPGSTVTLAIVSRPASGWHGYWRNPGDAGVETRVRWTLPPGVTAGALAYPVPTRLVVAGLMNYVYERPYALLLSLRIPADARPGAALPIAGIVDYLACTDQICVPERQRVQATLTVGDGTVAASRRAAFDAWRRLVPRPLDAAARFEVAEGQVRLAVPLPSAAAMGSPWFYPATPGVIDHAADQRASRVGDAIVIETAAPRGGVTRAVAGVLALGDGTGLAIAARPGAVPSVRPPLTAAALAFGGALLGGLLLNLMPCVFPILSLKALGLARAGEGEAQARAEALAYTAGVVLVCLALGGILLALRAAGASAGWAFQLQDPRIIGLLLVLVVAIALNLAGLFELPTPRVAGRGGAAGAFATGALAAFVATPCTGPFMGAALGAALVLPSLAALLVFAGLGIGIALPFLLIGFLPALRRRLPRPGAWMARLRRLLSLPMFATALALAWVLGRQTGVDGLVLALAAALVAALSLWWTGRRQFAGATRAWPPALAGLAAALALVAPLRPAAPAGIAAANAEPFSESRLAALRAQRRPVFAYFTADWCLTCKVNEAAAIDTAEARRAFQAGGVAVLAGDWTNGDPALGRFLERHGRAGVPLYLWYAPGSAQPRVLPQLLTPGLLAALPRDPR